MSSSGFSYIVAAIDALGRFTDRVGRTHVQKLVFLAESWQVVPPLHSFTLYLHGPYSRELDGEILALRAAGIVSAKADPEGFGARYAVDRRYASEAQSLLSRPSLDGVRALAEALAPLKVKQLEALATSEFVRKRSQLPDDGVRDRVRQLKPHLQGEEIERGIALAHELRARLGQ